MIQKKRALHVGFLGVLVLGLVASYQNCGSVNVSQLPNQSQKIENVCHHQGVDYPSDANTSIEFFNDDYICTNLNESFETAFFRCQDGAWIADSRNPTSAIDEFPFHRDIVQFPNSCTTTEEPEPRLPDPQPPQEPDPATPETVRIPGTGAPASICTELPRNENTESYYEYLNGLGTEPEIPRECLAIPGDLTAGKIQMNPTFTNISQILGFSVDQYRQAALRQGYDLVYATRNLNFNNAYGACGDNGPTGFGRMDGFSKNQFISMRFKTKPRSNGEFDFSLNSTWTPHPKANVLYTISKCPGDFGQIVPKGNAFLRTLYVDDLKNLNEVASGFDGTSSIRLDRCTAISTYAGTMAFKWSTTDSVQVGGCKLEPNETYYLNAIFRDALSQVHTCRALDVQEDLMGINLIANDHYSPGINCSIEYKHGAALPNAL